MDARCVMIMGSKMKFTFEEWKERVGAPNYTKEYGAAFKRLYGEDLDKITEDTLRAEYETYINDIDEGWTEVK